MPASPSLLRIYLLLIVLILCWSVNIPLSKMAFRDMPPIWFTFSRLLIGIAVTFLFLAARKQIKIPKPRDFPILLSVGFLQIGLYLVLFNYGMNYVNAGRAAILVYSTPIWVTPFAILFFGERLSRLKLLGLLLGLGGIFVLFSPTSFNWRDPHVLFGNGLLLIAAFCWAGAMLHTRYGKWHSSTADLFPWQLLVSIIPATILAPVTEPHMQITWTWTLIGILLYGGCVATAFGYWANLTISKRLPVTTTSISFLAVPVLSLVFSDFLLNEPLTFNNLIAVSLIIAGLMCIILDNQFA